MARGPDYQKERGERQRERILAAVSVKPMTSRELCDLLHMHQSRVSKYLRQLMAHPRRVYVSGYQERGPSLKPPRMFAAGNLQDAVFTKKPKPRIDRVAIQRQRVLELLALPQTSNQLAARMGLTQNRVRVYLYELRYSTPKRVYISAWLAPVERGSQAPVYALGDLPDAPLVRRSRLRKAKTQVQHSAWIATLTSMQEGIV